MLTAPLFLIGLVAVAIPIVIHLLQLRRYRKVYFSNVEMLQELQTESHQQSRLRRLLVLLARILAIVFLVLAFCRPVLPSHDSTLQAGATLVSVYVDNSFSMESGGMDGSQIETAKRKAREIAHAYRPDALFQLLTNDASGAQFRWLSRDEFLAAVDQVEPSPHTLALSTLAQRQNEFLRRTNAPNRHAYLISDFQQSTADIANYPHDTLVASTFVPLGGTEVGNIFLDTLAFNSPAYHPGATISVEATVTNSGSKAVPSLPLRLYVGGKQRAMASVDLPPHGSATATLSFAIGDESIIEGLVETTDYPVTFDDRLYFSLPVARQIDILAISGATPNPYIEKLFRDDSLVRYHHVAATQIDHTHLTEHSFILLDEMHSIPSGLAHTLQQFVADGGTLLVVPGENVEVQSYNQLLSALHAPLLDKWSDAPTQAQQVHTQATLYQGVFQSTPSQMELPSVSGHYRTAATGSTVAQPLISLLDGSPLLTLTPSSLGRCYLFSTPLRPEHTNLVQQALFVPTLYNMALFSSPLTPPYHLLSATNPIPLAHIYSTDAPPHLLAADGSTDLIPDLRRLGTRQSLLPHGEVDAPGHYRLTAPDGTSEGLAFNHSRQESHLTFYSRQEVKRLLLDHHLDHCSVAPPAQKPLSDHIRQHTQGRPLWRLCLILSLLALLAETLLLRFKK